MYIAAGAILAGSILSSCLRPQGRIRFAPEDAGAATSGIRPEFASAPRSRTQHTFGSIGENLFPVPTPDGMAILFSTSRQGPGFFIARKALGTAPVTAITSGPWNDIHPAISPDGRRLAFASDRDGGWGLYILEDRLGSVPRRLTGPEGDAFGPSWAPDSRRLAFFRRGLRTGSWEVWTLDVDGGSEEFLCQGLFPAWAPAGGGGQWIAYQTARERDGQWYSIWKIRADGSRPTELVAGETWGAVHPTWSPDGRWIAFAVMGKGEGSRDGAPGQRPGAGDIYLATAEGTHLTNLTGDHAGVTEWNPCFGPDARICFNSDEGGSVNVWSLDPGIPAASRGAGPAAPPPPVTSPSFQDPSAAERNGRSIGGIQDGPRGGLGSPSAP